MECLSSPAIYYTGSGHSNYALKSISRGDNPTTSHNITVFVCCSMNSTDWMYRFRLIFDATSLLVVASSIDNWRQRGKKQSKTGKRRTHRGKSKERAKKYMKNRRVIIVEKLRMLASGQSLVTRSEGL